MTVEERLDQVVSVQEFDELYDHLCEYAGWANRKATQCWKREPVNYELAARWDEVADGATSAMCRAYDWFVDNQATLIDLSQV